MNKGRNSTLKKFLILGIVFGLLCVNITSAINATQQELLTSFNDTKDNPQTISRNRYIPSIDWKKTYGAPDKYDFGYAVDEVTGGGYLVVGETNSFGGTKPWLLRLDERGNVLWNQTLQDYWGGVGRDFQETSDGGFIVTGYSNRWDGNGEEIILVKTDENGNELWYETFGGLEEDRGFSVRQTLDGGFIVGGHTRSFGAGNTDLWVIKTNATGVEEWNRTLGGINYEWMGAVRQTPDGGFVVAGSTNSFGQTRYEHVWLIKLNESGVEDWNYTYVHYFPGDKYFGSKASELQVTEDGGFIIAGYIRPESSGSNIYDIWLIKTNANGIVTWDRTHNILISNGKKYAEAAHSVDQTLFGGFIICGWQPGGEIYAMKTTDTGYKDWDSNSISGFGGRRQLDCIRQVSDGGYIMVGHDKGNFPPYNRDVLVIRLSKPLDISAHAGGPYLGFIDTPISFQGSAEGGIPPYLYNWDFGDGETSTLKNPSHTYTIPGNYTVRFSAADTTGLPGSSDDDHTYALIQESNSAPDTPLIAGRQRGAAGEYYNFTFQSFDPDENTISYYIEWGDGSNTGWLGSFQSGHTLTLDHMWEEQDRYTIRAKAKDIYGEESDWGTLEIRMPHSYNSILNLFELLERLSTRFPLMEYVLTALTT